MNGWFPAIPVDWPVGCFVRLREVDRGVPVTDLGANGPEGDGPLRSGEPDIADMSSRRSFGSRPCPVISKPNGRSGKRTLSNSLAADDLCVFHPWAEKGDAADCAGP